MSPEEVERLYREHAPSVLRRARTILRDEDDARDALQEIFLSLIDTEVFDERGGTTAWFYVRTTNLCLNRIRNGKNRARLRAVRLSAVGPAPGGGESRAVALDVLARLPAELAQVAVYYYCDEMTHEEIAVLLGCSRRHVGHLIERFHREVAATERAS